MKLSYQFSLNYGCLEMSNHESFVKKYALPLYFILTFMLSWVCMALIIYPDTFPMTPEQVETIGPLTYIALLVGPSIAGIIMIGLVHGKAGYQELLSRLFKWRVNIRWYVLATLATPILAIITLLFLSLFSPDFVPSIFVSEDRLSLVLMGIITGLMVGFFEELGWTGFAVPQMRLRHDIIITGVTVGLIWGAWHFLAFWEIDTFSGILPITLLFMRLFAWLPPFRILMVWLHDQTKSLLLVMLMHASLVFTTLSLPSNELSSRQLVIWLAAWAIALWFIVALIVKFAMKKQVYGSKC